MEKALEKLGIPVADTTTELDVQPISSRVHHIDEEMTSSEAPSLMHPIQLISAIAPQHTPPPLPLTAADHAITATSAAEVAAAHSSRLFINSHKSY